MWHSHLNDMEIPETERFIPIGFELGTTLSQPIGSINIIHFYSHHDDLKVCDLQLIVHAF